MAVVTISRQYGSGGEQIAVRACELLKCNYFDKQSIAQVASQVGLSEDEFMDFSEDNYKIHSFFDLLTTGWRGPRAIAQSQAWQEDLLGPGAETGAIIDEDQSIALIQQAVQTAYRHGNVIIVGRGGQAILQDKRNVLHVRIEAPLEFRRQRLHEKEGLDPAEAESRINQRDRAAASYLKRFYEIDWDDSTLYHLVINAAKFQMEAAAELIGEAVKRLR